jgi:hypothetical protein
MVKKKGIFQNLAEGFRENQEAMRLQQQERQIEQERRLKEEEHLR